MNEALQKETRTHLEGTHSIAKWLFGDTLRTSRERGCMDGPGLWREVR